MFNAVFPFLQATMISSLRCIMHFNDVFINVDANLRHPWGALLRVPLPHVIYYPTPATLHGRRHLLSLACFFATFQLHLFVFLKHIRIYILELRRVFSRMYSMCEGRLCWVVLGKDCSDTLRVRCLRFVNACNWCLVWFSSSLCPPVCAHF